MFNLFRCYQYNVASECDADEFDPEKLMNHVTSLLLFYPAVSKVTARLTDVIIKSKFLLQEFSIK